MTTRRATFSSLLVTAALLAAVAALIAAALHGAPGSPTREQRVHQIAVQVRCPVCQDLSVADSPSPLARQMRHQIEHQVAAGVPETDILRGFVDAYGPSVLLTPSGGGAGWALRVLPFLAIAAGAVVATLLLRRALAGSPRPGDRSSVEEPAEMLPSQRRQVELAVAELRREEP